MSNENNIDTAALRALAAEMLALPAFGPENFAMLYRLAAGEVDLLDLCAVQASTIVALKNEAANLQAWLADRDSALSLEPASQRDAIRAAAELVLSHRDGALPIRGWLRDNDASRAALQKLADALASQPAAPVQPVAWGLLSIQDPELTNDEQLAAYWSRKGREVTALYAAPTQAAPPVQQPGDVREDILGAVARGWCAPENASKVMDEALAFAIAREVQALATARPSAALTETQQRGLSALADRIDQAGGGPLYIDHTAATAIRAILAASSGAVAVPEWISVDERLPQLGQTVLCFSQEYGQRESSFERWPQGSINRAKYGDDVGYFRWSEPQNNWGSSWKPSHWMPRPAAPATPAQGQTK